MAGVGGGGATALMAQNRQRGHNFAKLGLTAKKNMCLLIFCTDATYKISIFCKLRGFSSFTTNKRCNGQTD